MDLSFARRTRCFILEMLDDAGFAESVEAFGDGGGVDEVSFAQTAGDNLIDVPQQDSRVRQEGHGAGKDLLDGSHCLNAWND